MKDIYVSMSSQNILNYYGSKLDISVDKSSFFDREQEKTEKYDLVLDNSETYDYQIDPIVDYQLDIELPTNTLVLKINLVTDDYYLMTVDGLILETVGYNQIQFQP
jgi:hypothetical protein